MGREGIKIKRLPSRYTWQAKNGTQKISKRGKSESCVVEGQSGTWTAQKNKFAQQEQNLKLNGQQLIAYCLSWQTKLRLGARDQFSVGSHPPTVA